jgi:class 3 adenylate cyclase
MVDQGEQRRLAAIFAADMVGYSRLMEADERGTIARQKIHRAELIDPMIAEHNGRIVKLMGDGMLVEFASVVDAVECAVAVQRAMGEREAEMPDDRRIQYRVGVNLGDIVIEDKDIFGDGVNIAARLEELAEPGGICISGTAYDQLKQKVDIGYEFLGEQQVKNITGPVRAYRALLDPEEAGKVIDTRQKPHIPWAAVAAAVALLVAAAIGGA